MASRRPAVTLQRPALVQRLADLLDAGAVALVAPAGGGKATTLQAALSRRRGAAAWVRCTEADVDAARLLARVIAALRGAAPGVADALGATLAAAAEPVFTDEAVAALVGELETRLAGPLTLVVDDAEHLDGAQAALALVGALIGVRTPELRVAVLSRRSLPLRAAVLDADALAFTIDECRGLLGVSADAEGVWAATEGWPMGIVLAVRSGRTLEDPAALDEYLSEILLAPLDAEVREAVTDASVLPELDRALLAALDLPADFLDQVRRGGVPLRRGGGAVAFHPLVQEFLLRRLATKRPSEYRDLLRTRTAAALEAVGRGGDAVEFWLASPDDAGAAVARQGGAVVDTAPATLARWLSRVPGPARLAPELRLLEGRLALGTSRPLDAPAPLRDAVLGFGARGDAEREWAARVSLIDALVALERFDAAIPFANGFEAASAPAAPMAGISGAAALAGAGRYDEAAAQFERAEEHPRGAPFLPFAAAFRGRWVDVPRGELEAALQRVAGAVADLERADPFKRLAYVLMMLGLVQDERGEADAALETTRRARSVAVRLALGGFAGAAARRLAAALLARAGRVEEAEAELAGATAGAAAGEIAIVRATIAARRGQGDVAVAEARRAIDEGALAAWGSRRRNVALLAPVLAEAGEAAWARELIDETVAARPEGGSVARLLELRC